MAHGNRYWLAAQQATVPDGWVSEDALRKWVSKGGIRANSVRMLNGAFEAWFLLRRSIESCEDGTHKAMMLTELEDAGDAGWGTGVQDLDDAFEEWLEPGKWRMITGEPIPTRVASLAARNRRYEARNTIGD